MRRTGTIGARTALVALALCACRFDFDPVDHANADAPHGDGATGDGLALVTLPFTNVTELSYLNDGGFQDDDPSLTDDMLELYFDSERPGGGGMGDCWVAKRPSIDQPFGAPALVAELDSPADDTTFDISGDGLTMYFGSDRLVAGDRDLYVTTRADRSSPWGTPQRVVELSSPYDDSGATELADHLHLVFASARNGQFDIYMATRTAVGQPWGNITPLPGLNDPTWEDSQHWVNRDGTIVYFVSDRPGSQQQDIWVATRTTPDGTFDPPRLVTELATEYLDGDPWLSPDLHTLFFWRSTTVDGWHLWTASR